MSVQDSFTEEAFQFVKIEAIRIGWGTDGRWDANMAARQIVDNAWRAGIDIRFKQHLVERWLSENEIKA